MGSLWYNVLDELQLGKLSMPACYLDAATQMLLSRYNKLVCSDFANQLFPLSKNSTVSPIYPSKPSKLSSSCNQSVQSNQTYTMIPNIIMPIGHLPCGAQLCPSHRIYFLQCISSRLKSSPSYLQLPSIHASR